MDRYFFIMDAPRIVAALYLLLVTQAITIGGGWWAVVLFRTIPIAISIFLLLPYVKYVGL